MKPYNLPYKTTTTNNILKFKIKPDYLIYSFIFMLMTLATFLWSINLLREWANDYGVYYANAKYMSNNFTLYGEIFANKGPLYYIFLRLLGNLYGWGVKQAVLSLFITVMTFVIATSWISFKYKLSKWCYLSVALLTIATFFQQPSNACIAYFQATFMILSFFYLIYSVKMNNIWYVHISLICLLLATLVRIDALAFVALHIMLYVWHFHRSAKEINIFFHITIIFVLILSSIFIPPILFKYNFSAYLLHNIDFNIYYRTKLLAGIVRLLYRPEATQILVTSGLLIFIISILSNITNVKSKIIDQQIENRHTTIDFEGLVALAVLVFSFLLWIISGSDKDYHIFILVTGVLIFIIHNIDRYIRLSLLYIMIPYLFYVIFLATAPGAYTIKRNIANGIFWNAYNESSKSLMSYKNTIDVLKESKSAYVIGGGGWLYLFSDTIPLTPINNWWFYYYKPGYKTENLVNSHRKLMNSVGVRYILDEGILTNPTKYLQELLEKSYFICFPDESKRYSIWEVAKEKTIDYNNEKNSFPKSGIVSTSSRCTKENKQLLSF